jgi:hypothetical protein
VEQLGDVEAVRKAPHLGAKIVELAHMLTPRSNADIGC